MNDHVLFFDVLYNLILIKISYVISQQSSIIILHKIYKINIIIIIKYFKFIYIYEYIINYYINALYTL